MKQRTITTVVLWVGILILLWLFGVYAGLLLITALAVMAQHETYGLLGRVGGDPLVVAGLVAGVLFILITSGLLLFLGSVDAYPVSLGLVFPSLVAWVMFRTPVRSLSRCLFPTLIGFLLVPACLTFFALLAMLPGLTEGQGLFLAVWVVAVAKFSDIGALLIGSRIGRRPLAPSYSPKKTIEGAIGGVLTSVLVACLVPALSGDLAPAGLTFWICILLGLVLGTTAIVSDLLGSALKRIAGVKDSGKRIPGIGGGLDLVDSLLCTGPLGYAILSLALK
ncbi:MAG: CDP-archaeol synthase [Verrucomicrobiota bacterium]